MLHASAQCDHLALPVILYDLVRSVFEIRMMICKTHFSLNINKRISVTITPGSRPDKKVTMLSIHCFQCYRIRVYPHKQ